jgi:hydroxymethylpyrimidine pyrophosphatase-like HAD family hydrolase
VPDDTVIDVIDALLEPPAVKLMLRHPELSGDDLLAHARELIGDLVEVSHSSPHDALLEISAPGVSKASALAAVCAELGVAPGRVMAFGDMPNDLAMLSWAGWGVAVANAHADVIAAADEVTASNDEAGVAAVLERLVADQ